MKKNILVSISLLLGTLMMTPSAFAHVVVTPSEVGVGMRQNFVVSVPTEEENPTVQLRLVIPEGLQSVRPNVKPGWDISLTKSGEGDEAVITEIIWSGGSIPAEQRDEFVFRAMAPAEETTIVWKAYQTYGDGKIVAWDSTPTEVEEYTKKNPPVEGQHDDAAPNPYSETKVINDLTETGESADGTVTTQGVSQDNSSRILSMVAVLLAAGALGMQLFYKKKKA